MTFDAWRSAVGGQWRRLLLYPGGLTVLALAAVGWGLWRFLGWRRRPQSAPNPLPWQPTDLLALAGPWVALALLPLPHSSELRSPLDLPTAWLLCDLPLALAVARGWRGGAQQQIHAARWALGWLVALPLLATILVVFGSRTSTLTIADLPGLTRPRSAGWLVLFGWLAALLPALQLGPWAAGAGLPGLAGLGLALRRAGHVGVLSLAALPLWPVVPAAASGWWPTLQRDGRGPAALTAAAIWVLLLLLDRAGRGRSAVLWGRALWALAAGLLLTLLWQNGA
jgi:hypothetical protein